jgi:hypothetical protein
MSSPHRQELQGMLQGRDKRQPRPALSFSKPLFQSDALPCKMRWHGDCLLDVMQSACPAGEISDEERPTCCITPWYF